jgi:hypothetical protein
MASTFPTSLDTFTNPTATSLLTSPSHSLSHSDLNDAVEALEAKVAIGNTVLGTYQAYTPTFTAGITVGDGTFSSAYATVNKLTHYYGSFVFGSTSAVSGSSQTLSLPTTADSSMTAFSFSGFLVSQVLYYDTSAFSSVVGACNIVNSTTARFFAESASGTYTTLSVLSSTVPFTWATDDRIYWNFIYRTA